MREVRPGLWHWEAPHPDWKAGEDWGQIVSSYAIDDGERLLLLDPLAVPDRVLELAAQRETACREPNGLASRLTRRERPLDARPGTAGNLACGLLINWHADFQQQSGVASSRKPVTD